MSWLRKAIDRVVDVYFGIPSTMTEEKTMRAYIVENNGVYGLKNPSNGSLFGTYSRRRDAVRGAKRRGLTLS